VPAGRSGPAARRCTAAPFRDDRSAEIRSRIAGAYSATGAAWQSGPGRIYDELSEHLVASSPVDLAGRVVLDLGAGTGAATRALLRRGALPVALDAADGMLRAGSAVRPAAAVADISELPVRSGAVGGVVAAYVLNHLSDPVRALREAARVSRPGGPILAAVYADDDGHVVRAAVDQAVAEAGHRADDWYGWMRDRTFSLLSTVSRADAALRAAGLTGRVTHDRIAFPGLTPEDLVAWRLGMAHVAPFVARLDEASRRRLSRRAVELLGADPPLLERSVITIVAVA
jgi:ubiquinone/menaquinone biosynthesis C-methylase UbiE